MKAILIPVTLLLIGLASHSQAQSTTGGRSGGSSASTGAGYESGGKRPSASSAASMTIADEGASRAYMYVPPTPKKNQSASPDGSGAATPRQTPKTSSKSAKKTN